MPDLRARVIGFMKAHTGLSEKMAVSIDSISTLVEADKTVLVKGQVKDKPFTCNGIPMPMPFDKEQPVA